MNKDAELYQLLGRLEGKIDSISDRFILTSQRIDKLENSIANQHKELSHIKQIQARHAVIVTAVATIFSAIVVHFFRDLV